MWQEHKERPADEGVFDTTVVSNGALSQKVSVVNGRTKTAGSQWVTPLLRILLDQRVLETILRPPYYAHACYIFLPGCWVSPT